MARRSGLSARSGSIQAAIVAARGTGPADEIAAVSGPAARCKGRTIGLTLRLDEEAHDRLRRIAFEKRVSIHSLLLEGVEAVLAKHGSQL